MAILFISLGLRKTFILIVRYPELIILSTISSWTIGPVKSSICGFGKDNRLRISFTLTWLNLMISIIMTSGFYVCYFYQVQELCKNNEFFVVIRLIIPILLCAAMFVIGNKIVLSGLQLWYRHVYSFWGAKVCQLYVIRDLYVY